MRLGPIIVAACLCMASPATAQPDQDSNATPDAPETNWRVALTGGFTTYEGDTEFYSEGVTITRKLGASYVQVGITHLSAGDRGQSVVPVPSKEIQGSLAAGTSFGALSVDANAIVGRRSFPVQTISGPQPGQIDTSASSFGGAVFLTYDVEMSENNFISPYLGVHYSHIRTSRVSTFANGNGNSAAIQSNSWGGIAGLSYARMFGSKAKHTVSAFAEYVIVSDNSAFSLASGQIGSAGGSTMLSSGQADGWVAVGASGSFGLSDRLRMRVSTSQTVGLAGQEATTGSVGVSIAF